MDCRRQRPGPVMHHLLDRAAVPGRAGRADLGGRPSGALGPGRPACSPDGVPDWGHAGVRAAGSGPQAAAPARPQQAGPQPCLASLCVAGPACRVPGSHPARRRETATSCWSTSCARRRGKRRRQRDGDPHRLLGRPVPAARPVCPGPGPARLSWGQASAVASSAAVSATNESSAGAAASSLVDRTAITIGPRPVGQAMPTSLVVP